MNRRILVAMVLMMGSTAGLLRSQGTFTEIPSPNTDYINSTTLFSVSVPDGSSVTSLSQGPQIVNFSIPMRAASVPTTWATWNCPPSTESCTPRVLWAYSATSVTLTFSVPVTTVGFEAEPDPFEVHTITATFKYGTTVLGTISLPINGDAGAQLEAATDTQPITSVVISSDTDFAIAQLRAGGTLPPSIQITLSPSPHADQYLITATPSMPFVQASAKVINVLPDPTPNTTFTWTAHLTTNENGGTGQAVNYDQDIVQNSTTTGSAPYTLTLPDPTAFRGGHLTILATATVGGKSVTGQTPSDLVINGTNPQRAAIQKSISDQVPNFNFRNLQVGDAVDVLQRIACFESGQAQFEGGADGGKGAPLVNSGNDVGVFQIHSGNPDLFVTNPNIVFSWLANVTAGLSTYQNKVGIASNYPNLMKRSAAYIAFIKNTINPQRIAAGLSPLHAIPAPPFTFQGQIGSNPPNQLLEDAVRGYNGYAGTAVFCCGVLHEFIPNTDFLLTVPDSEVPHLATNPNVWLRVCSDPTSHGVLYGPAGSTSCAVARGSSGDPKYVNDVAAKSPRCGD